MYASYDFYMETFGGVIPAEGFQRAEQRAEAYIRALTYINGDIFAVENDTVKTAVCAAAEVVYEYEYSGAGTGTGNKAIKSESNDGYSVTYVSEATDGQTSEELLRKKVYDIVRLYLLPTGWLSRKVKTGGGYCGDHYCNCTL